jgi:hypothetical protein
VDSSELLGRYRWIMEARSPGWSAFRPLATRYDRQGASVLAFLHLARALICLRFLQHAEAEAHETTR